MRVFLRQLHQAYQGPFPPRGRKSLLWLLSTRGSRQTRPASCCYSMGACMTRWPPALAKLAAELPFLNPGEAARVLSILGAHRKSVVGELPETPRSAVLQIIRRAKQRLRSVS